MKIFGYRISKKLAVTTAVLVMCAFWMFGGEGVRGSLSGAPEQLRGFLGWLGDMTPLVVAITVWSYNTSQGKVDAAIEEAKGTVEATRLAVKKKVE